MTRVLITNAYSARNRGDAAIVLGMVEALRATDVFRDAELRISSADHVNDARWYPVATVPSFASLKSRVSGVEAVNQLYFLAVLLPVSLVWAMVRRHAGIELPLPRDMTRMVAAYSEADLVVAAGGGYLYTTSAVRGGVVLLTQLMGFLFGVLLGKPVVLYAQSIGPFAAGWQAALVRWAVARVDLVEVREDVSRRLLEGWSLPTPISSACDAAFLLAASPPDGVSAPLEPSHGPTVGMTVRRWFRRPERQAAYEGAMAAFVRWLVRDRGASVVLLPQVTFAEGGDDDRVVARRVAGASGLERGVRIVDDELTAAEVKWWCGRVDLFVGTRMHSNIFALSSGVPTVAVAYQPKTAGIMARLGLERWVVPIEDVTADGLRRVFDDAVAASDEIGEILRVAIPRLEADARAAGERVAGIFLARRGGRVDASEAR
jgi:colanic acid/amylovoran biosynthesis protein